MINSDEVRFVKAKKKAQLRIKDQLGPFICNNREEGKEAEEILQRLKLKQSFIWRYDPLDFICDRRQKNKLSPYVHHKVPKIERYENQLEWVENTLVDRDSTEVIVNNVLIDLERRLDEDSFVQVLGESQSQRETQKHSEKLVEEGPQEKEESEQPNISEELAQPEHIMSNLPIVQTPLNEEKNPKRDREQVIPSSKSIAQTYVKTQRLNHLLKQDFTEEIVRTTGTKRAKSRNTTPSRGTQEPSTSQVQMLERQQSMEVSSFRAPIGQNQDIREKYKEIKAIDEILKAQRYAQYLKMAPTNQTRIMSTFDVK